MKVRNYEKKNLVMFFMILLLIVEGLVIIILSTIKVEKYTKISGVVIKDNLVLLVVDKDERGIIYSNKVLFFDNHKFKYKIIEDRGIVLKKNRKNYYQLVLSFNFKNKYKANDIVEIVLVKEKMRLIEIFKIIWEGG